MASWWVKGLYAKELAAAAPAADTAYAVAWLSALSGAETAADIDRVSAALGLETNALLALCATPPEARTPLEAAQPAWAAPLPVHHEAVLALPIWQAWAAQSETAPLILPLVTEVYEALAPVFARLDAASGRADIADGALDKLLYVLDKNLCAAADAPIENPEAFWHSRPASLRHARAVASAFKAAVLRFEAALQEAPAYINLAALTHLFIEPLDLHRGGTSVVMAEGAGVFQPRETVAFDLLQQLLVALHGEGMLLRWRVPRYHGTPTGTWVEWVSGTDLDDMTPAALEAMGPELASFAVLMWVFGAAGIEPESVMAVRGSDRVCVVQADGLFAPDLGTVDEPAQLESWLALFFDNPDLPHCPRFTAACQAQALAALDVAARIAPDLTKKASAARPVRCFVRPVWAYSELLRAVPNLQAAGDGLARDLVFSRVRDLPENFAGLEALPVVRAELADLQRYDLPFVSACPAGSDIFFDDTRSLSGFVLRTAVEQILWRVGDGRQQAVKTVSSYSP